MKPVSRGASRKGENKQHSCKPSHLEIVAYLDLNEQERTVSAFDAVDGSSTGTVSAMNVGAVKAPRLRGAKHASS
jgi:hypothetical protein